MELRGATRQSSEAERHLLEPLEAPELPTTLGLAGTAVRANQGLAGTAVELVALVDILEMVALVAPQMLEVQQQVLAVLAEGAGMVVFNTILHMSA